MTFILKSTPFVVCTGLISRGTNQKVFFFFFFFFFDGAYPQYITDVRSIFLYFSVTPTHVNTFQDIGFTWKRVKAGMNMALNNTGKGWCKKLKYSCFLSSMQ